MRIFGILICLFLPNVAFGQAAAAPKRCSEQYTKKEDAGKREKCQDVSIATGEALRVEERQLNRDRFDIVETATTSLQRQIDEMKRQRSTSGSSTTFGGDIMAAMEYVLGYVGATATAGWEWNQHSLSYVTVSAAAPVVYLRNKRLMVYPVGTLGTKLRPGAKMWGLGAGFGLRLFGHAKHDILEDGGNDDPDDDITAADHGRFILYGIVEGGFTSFMRKLVVNNTDRDGWGVDIGVQAILWDDVVVQATVPALACRTREGAEGLCTGFVLQVGATTF